MRSIQNFDPTTITESPRLPDTHGATWENAGDRLLAAGWRKLDAREPYTPPEGEHVTGYLYEQDTERPEYAVELPVTAPIPIPTPERFPAGIDAPTNTPMPNTTSRTSTPATVMACPR